MGGHSSGGLFPGTSGGGSAARQQSSDGAESGSPKVYSATPQLREHIAEAGYGGRRAGIIGGHEKSSFDAKAEELGVSIDKRTPNAHIEGVERVEYRLPKRDASGKPTGGFQSDVKSKTIYDSKKISTDEYISRGMQAANEAAGRSATGKLGRRWSGVDNKGVTWVGYTGADGNVSTFYPDE